MLKDLLFLYKRFHRCFEDDRILIFDIGKKKNSLIARLDELKTEPLIGGWVEIFLNSLTSVTSNDTTIYKLFDVSLKRKQRRGAHNELVSDKRCFDAIWNEVVLAVTNFLEERLDDEYSESTKAISLLRQLNATATDQELKECHRIICPDLSLRDFVMG